MNALVLTHWAANEAPAMHECRDILQDCTPS